MSKFLKTWEWVHHKAFEPGTMWMEGSGFWRPLLLNLDAIMEFAPSVEVCGRERTFVTYRDRPDASTVICHDINQIGDVLFASGVLVADARSSSHDEP